MNSWKEIATFLGRGVTTVQRWEREENLPVHRLLHDRQGSVYAFRDELETWVAQHSERSEPENEAATAVPAPDDAVLTIRITRRSLLMGAVAAGAVATAAAGLRSLRRGPAANACSHAAKSGKNVLTYLTAHQGWLYAACRRPAGGGEWAILRMRSPAELAKAEVMYRGVEHVERIVPYGEYLLFVYHDPAQSHWLVVRNHDGLHPRTGAGANIAYRGDARVDNLVPHQGGVLASFSGSPNDEPCGIYFSRDGLRLGETELRHEGRLRATLITPFQGGLITAFVNEKSGESEGAYWSKYGTALGKISPNTEYVMSPIRGMGQVERCVVTRQGVLTAFHNPDSGKGWGIFLSRDGRLLSGGTGAPRVQPGPTRTDAIAAHGEGVVCAFYDPRTGKAQGIFYSPDSENLSGGGKTVLAYEGPLRVSAMIPWEHGLLASFRDPVTGDGRGFSFSPDGRRFAEPS